MLDAQMTHNYDQLLEWCRKFIMRERGDQILKDIETTLHFLARQEKNPALQVASYYAHLGVLHALQHIRCPFCEAEQNGETP